MIEARVSVLPRYGRRQVVEEDWLVRWTKFVLGRGARRYHAPGEIDNRSLLDAPNKARKVNSFVSPSEK